MKKLTALLLAVLLVFTLAACKKTENAPVAADSVIGTYVLTAASQDGNDISLDGVAPMYVVLEEDNTGTYGPEGDILDITWSQEGNTVTLISEQIGSDNPFVLTYDGETLSGTTEGLAMTYTRQ